MDDLVEFLRARLAEDEQAAKAATDGPWTVDNETYAEAIRSTDGTNVVAGGRWGDEASVFETTEDAIHIARHDPARALREVERDRRIISEHAITVEKVATSPYDPCTGERRPDEYEVTCAICGWASNDPSSSCLTLRLLALPYADHPDFKDGWKV